MSSTNTEVLKKTTHFYRNLTDLNPKSNKKGSQNTPIYELLLQTTATHKSKLLKFKLSPAG